MPTKQFLYTDIVEVIPDFPSFEEKKVEEKKTEEVVKVDEIEITGPAIPSISGRWISDATTIRGVVFLAISSIVLRGCLGSTRTQTEPERRIPSIAIIDQRDLSKHTTTLDSS